MSWVLTCSLYRPPDQPSPLFLYPCLPSDTPKLPEAKDPKVFSVSPIPFSFQLPPASDSPTPPHNMGRGGYATLRRQATHSIGHVIIQTFVF